MTQTVLSSTRRLLTCAAMAFLPSASGAQPPAPADSTVIARAVLATLEDEQRAFAERDCPRSVAFFEPYEPLFVVAGRVIPSRDVLAQVCAGMVAARGPAPRQLVTHTVHVLASTAAPSISVYRVVRDGEPEMRQVVTKVWHAIDGGWRIAHLHESTGPWSAGGSPRDRPPPR